MFTVYTWILNCSHLDHPPDKEDSFYYTNMLLEYIKNNMTKAKRIQVHDESTKCVLEWDSKLGLVYLDWDENDPNWSSKIFSIV